MRIVRYFCLSLLLAGYLACSPAGGEKRGHEFMPDMVHSTAYEANLYDYYYYNTWGTEEEYMEYAMPRQSVPGTIARGDAGVALASTPGARLDRSAYTGESAPNAIAIPMNGAVPYPYQDTEADRVRASQEIVNSPIPVTAAGLMKGQELYTVYCGICHGAKGDGLGYLVREADPAKGITAGVYPAAPANLLRDIFVDTTAGLFYHAIVYGKNMMGAYADKLSYEERWDVIHYVRSLQAKSVGKVYNESENTFNGDLPGASIVAHMEAASMPSAAGEEKEAEDQSEGESSHDTHDGGH